MVKLDRLGDLASDALYALRPKTYVRGVPLPPKTIVDMHKTAQEGFAFSHTLVKRLAHYGVDVKTGHIFDVGCGWGRLAFGLLDGDFAGRYDGVEINPRQVRFLKREFTPKAPHFSFHHFDFHNDYYNADGAHAPFDAKDYLNGATPDAIILLSVFTHMYEADILAYIDSFASVMSPETQLIFSAFTYDEDTLARLAAGEGRFSMPHVHSDTCRFESQEHPLFAISYDREWLTNALAERGLAGDVHNGSWSGLKAPDFQDWVCVRRAA